MLSPHNVILWNELAILKAFDEGDLGQLPGGDQPVAGTRPGVRERPWDGSSGDGCGCELLGKGITKGGANPERPYRRAAWENPGPKRTLANGAVYGPSGSVPSIPRQEALVGPGIGGWKGAFLAGAGGEVNLGPQKFRKGTFGGEPVFNPGIGLGLVGP